MTKTTLSHRRIRDILSFKGRAVLTISPSVPVIEAVRTMNRDGVGCIVVSETDRIPVGILTERDILRRIVDEGRDPKVTPVEEVMTTSLVSLSTDATIIEAMRTMTDRRIRHLPIIDNDRMVGLISIGDITRATTELLEQEIEQLRSYIDERSSKST